MTQDTLKNRTIFCRDNLDVLRGINSNSIDLIYLDPPFNKKKIFAASAGSAAEGAAFSDVFREKDVEDEWVQTIQENQDQIHHFLDAVKHIESKMSYNYCYLCYMAIRLIEMHRILKDTGSIYLHCDSTMSHYLKLLLDCVFGEQNFRNEIVWCYSTPSNARNHYPRKTDAIFFYTKRQKYTFNAENIRIPYKRGKLDGKGWDTGKKYSENEVNKGKIVPNWWHDITPVQRLTKEMLSYPTQKPLALLERIIEASSNKGDIVLDPFCGCATTCVAAERLNRQWIGIDVSKKAFELVKERLSRAIEQAKLVSFSTIPPKRTDRNAAPDEQKYVYVMSHKQYKGEYKVGIAKNLKARLNSYQTSDFRAYKLDFFLLTPQFRAIKAHIHRKYEQKHEWIKGDLNAIIKDIKSCNI